MSKCTSRVLRAGLHTIETYQLTDGRWRANVWDKEDMRVHRTESKASRQLAWEAAMSYVEFAEGRS